MLLTEASSVLIKNMHLRDRVSLQYDKDALLLRNQLENSLQMTNESYSEEGPNDSSQKSLLQGSLRLLAQDIPSWKHRLNQPVKEQEERVLDYTKVGGETDSQIVHDKLLNKPILGSLRDFTREDVVLSEKVCPTPNISSTVGGGASRGKLIINSSAKYRESRRIEVSFIG